MVEAEMASTSALGWWWTGGGGAANREKIDRKRARDGVGGGRVVWRGLRT